jgi:hypothetical protein
MTQHMTSFVVTGAAVSVVAAVLGRSLAALVGVGAPTPPSTALNGYAE